MIIRWIVDMLPCILDEIVKVFRHDHSRKILLFCGQLLLLILPSSKWNMYINIREKARERYGLLWWDLLCAPFREKMGNSFWLPISIYYISPFCFVVWFRFSRKLFLSLFLLQLSKKVSIIVATIRSELTAKIFHFERA